MSFQRQEGNNRKVFLPGELIKIIVLMLDYTFKNTYTRQIIKVKSYQDRFESTSPTEISPFLQIATGACHHLTSGRVKPHSADSAS